MMPAWLLTLCLVTCAATWNPFSQAEVIVAHVIPHSHCDPGWLNTFEGYYLAEVKMILDGVTAALSADSTKKFVWAEISFFSRWYETLSDQQKQNFKKLVDAGQLEFVGGGWVQNDEANPDYIAIINQVTEGHQYLLKNFGVAPRIAWQIDPFGHSAVTPSLFSLMGYESLVINRIHRTLKINWRGQKHLEFIWQGVDVGPDESTNETVSLFTHVLFKHYSAVTGFDWEEQAPPISDGNVGQRAMEFCRYVKERSKAYRTNRLLVPFGDDFKFKRAQYQFQQMDALIAHINAHSDTFGVKVVYSTLAEYFEALHATNEKFPVYRGDFFPYADNEDSYWTGYYTTRPTLKILSRRLERTLRSAEQLHAVVRSSPDPGLGSDRKNLAISHWEDIFKGIERARREAALFLHHDAITGTSRAEVVSDYEQRINSASTQLSISTCRLLEHALTREPNPSPVFTPDSFVLLAPSNTNTNNADSSFLLYPIMIYNSLAWKRKEIVSVSTSTPHVVVLNAAAKPILSQVDHTFARRLDTSVANVYRVSFVVEIPALGAVTYFVRVYPRRPSNQTEADNLAKRGQTTVFARDQTGHKRGDMKETSDYAKILSFEALDEIMFENDIYGVHFSKSTGMMERINDKSNQITVRVAQTFSRYSSSRSGAYIFRPDGPKQNDVNSNPAVVQLTRGPVINTLDLMVGDYEVSARLASGGDKELAGHVMLDHNVFTQGNKELVITFATDVVNNGKIWTHNGLEFMERTRGTTTAANLYPMVAGARLSGLASKNTQTRFTIWTDHSMACGSQHDGELDLTVHRHLNQDDGRGLAQAVSDYTHVDIPLWVALDEGRSQLDFKRRSLRLNFPIQIFYHQGKEESGAGGGVGSGVDIAKWRHTQFMEFSALKEPLPRNIHLLSLLGRDSISDDIVLRLHHLGGRHSWSKNMSDIFAPYLNPTELRPVTLSINHVIRDGHPRLKFLVDEREQKEMQAVGPSAEEQDKQNSEEEGVFISQAALDKAKADAVAAAAAAPAAGIPPTRRLLSLSTSSSNSTSSDGDVDTEFDDGDEDENPRYFDHSFISDVEYIASDHDELMKEEDEDDEDSDSDSDEGEEEEQGFSDAAAAGPSRRLLGANGGNSNDKNNKKRVTVNLRPGQIKSYLLRLASPDTRSKDEAVRPAIGQGYQNLVGGHAHEAVARDDDHDDSSSDTTTTKSNAADGGAAAAGQQKEDGDQHGFHIRGADGVLYFAPATHSHSVMPAHGPRYLPSRTEYVLVILLTLTVVSYFLVRLQILSCTNVEETSDKKKERVRYVRTPV